MKKVFKSISVLVLSLALAVSGLTFVQTAKADAGSDWVANAIKTPTAGSLVGAGYIDVEFDNSLPGYTYEVFLDDNPVYWKDGSILRPELGEDTSQGTRKTFTTSDTPVTEVYTTGVSSHKITVKATSTGNPTYTSDLTFYVSKKGLAMGENMFFEDRDKVALQKLNCSWYYNWSTSAFNNSVDDGVAHIPMMWGADSAEAIQNMNTNSNYILGFNEPDIESQANMGFWDAVDVWKQYISPLKMRKVSPAPADPNGGSGWLYSFMNGDEICFTHDGIWDYYYWYKDDPSIVPIFKEGVDDVDSVCLHYYQGDTNAQGLIKAVDKLWNTYHKPVWITEIGVFGVKGSTMDYSYDIPSRRAEIQAFLTEVVEGLESRSYVERYCWFPYDVESRNEIDGFDGSGATAMFEYRSGKYTDLGIAYSQMANPAGYNAATISESEKFNWNERIIDGETTTQPVEQPTTQAPKKDGSSSGKTVSKPGKAKLKAKNIKKKSVKLSWSAVSGASKYKVQWAMNKKFTKKVKNRIVTKPTLKVTKLKKKKTYFFRVAAINSAGTGAWSNVKKIKIKK